MNQIEMPLWSLCCFVIPASLVGAVLWYWGFFAEGIDITFMSKRKK